MLSDREMLERMRSGWHGGISEGTVCGNGSKQAATENIRRWLPDLVTRLGILSVCDAGAGDLHWISRMRWSVSYRAFDLLPRSAAVEQIDISTQPLPMCDAILCRMVLNHLDTERVMMALRLFKLSSRYLIATQYCGNDLPQRSAQFTRLDLRRDPYCLGDPLESVPDCLDDCCSLAVWQF